MVFNSSSAMELQIPFNHADPPMYGNPKDSEMTTAKIVIISIMTTSNVFMLLGNSLSVYIILSSPSLRRHTYYWLVLNLAVLDLMNSLIVVPINIVWEFHGNWPFTQLFCNIEIFFDLGFGIVATYSTVLLSLDKYMYIARPFTYNSYVGPKMTLGSIGVTWVVWMTYSAVSVFGDLARSTKSYKYDYPLDDCNFVLKHTYAITSFVLVFIIPMMILTFTSIRILCVARWHIKKIKQCRPQLPDTVTTSYDLSTARPSAECSTSSSRDCASLPSTHNITSKSFHLDKQKGVVSSTRLHVTNATVTDPQTSVDTSPALTTNEEILPHNNTNSKTTNSLQTNRSVTTKSRISRAFGTVILVVVVFIIMFAPYWIASVINLGCVCIQPMVIENYLAVFYYMHSLVNPYIYMATDRRYKKAIWKIWAKCWCCKIFDRNSVSPNVPFNSPS